MSNDEVVENSASFEEASRCPKCSQPGELGEERSGPNKSTIYIIWCRNQVCRWYNTNWIVQRLSDGTVPIREEQERRPKTFPTRKTPSNIIERARKYAERGVGDDTKPGP